MKTDNYTLIKDNACDLIALTYNGEPIRFTDKDSEVYAWLSNGNEYDWYCVDLY